MGQYFSLRLFILITEFTVTKEHQMKIKVIIRGGIVQAVFSDQECNVEIVDYDNEPERDDPVLDECPYQAY